MVLTLATFNAHKADELSRMLASHDLKIRVQSLKDISFDQDIIEDARTFEGNALKKVKTVGKSVEGWIMADDSGICVDALDGKPGIHSARFAGEAATDEDNLQKLLADLTSQNNRKAYYHCSLVLYKADDQVYVTQGRIHGTLRTQPQGEGGFGYDPIFEPEGFERTMAELSIGEKNRISHRTLALHAMIPHLQRITSSTS